MTLIKFFCTQKLFLVCVLYGSTIQANCEWDGTMTRTDFIGVGIDIVKVRRDISSGVLQCYIRLAGWL